MERGTNQYKGLRTDISYDSIGEGFYIEAINLRITTTSGESQTAITNFKGNQFYFTVPQLGTGISEIIGVTYIRNVIVFFVADDGSGSGWIYKINYDEVTGDLLSSPILLYTDSALNFTKQYPIEALGRYESDCVKRVYWVDYNNYFRSINIEDPNLATSPLGLIDIFPNIKYTQLLITGILGGGALVVGNYEYAYRLITFDGKQSLISPPSKIIHIVQDSEGVSTSNQYTGDPSSSSSFPTGTNSFKTVKITIDTSNYSDFESIELIAIHHFNYTAPPTVTSVETKIIVGTTVDFLHTGSETASVTLELFEYASKQYPFKTFKTLTSKDNSLIPANIKGSDFDAQTLLTQLGEFFDAKSFRYLPDGVTVAPTGEFNEEYNKDAHWDIEWHKDLISDPNPGQYKYKNDGTTLGGSGINVSFNFHLEPFVVDTLENPATSSVNNAQFNDIDLQDGYGNYFNNSFDSQASPFRSGINRGYKRGETYRFGIIFYNKKGEASFVEHIGDIKFPDIGEDNGTETIPGSGITYFPLSRETYRVAGTIITTAYALGIQFNIDFSSCPNFLNFIDSYQIVRVRRTNTDSRRLCTGIMKTTMKFNIWGNNNTDVEPSGWDDENYDLRGPGKSNDILHLFSYHRGWGVNGNFHTINNNLGQGSDTYAQFPIHGSFLTFYSADLSFDWGQTIRSTAEGEAGALLLMTGRYGQYFSNVQTVPSGEFPSLGYSDNNFQDNKSFTIVHSAAASSEHLGLKMTDHRRKMRTTAQVNKTTPARAIEYVKKWTDKAIVNFDAFNTIDTTPSELNVSLGPYNGYDETGTTVKNYYLRNFYAHLQDTSQGLNDHRSSPSYPNYLISIFHKGVLGLTGSIDKIIVDPITGVNLSSTSNSPHFEYNSGATLIAPIPESGAPLNEGSISEAALTSTPILDILIPRVEIYGGFNQDALESNVFIPVSAPIDTSELTPIVYGGDIFLNMFVFQEGTGWIEPLFYQDHATGDPWQEFQENSTLTNCFVTESRTNIDLSFGATVKTGVKFNVEDIAAGGLVTEEIWRQETKNFSSDYGEQERFNMYNTSYNGAYSSESNEVLFFIKPAAFQENCNSNDIRAFLSDIKTNEEEIDSWTKFGINNFYDVDDYGPINKVVNFKNEVYFFQDKGVGKYSINPRAIVSTDDGIPTELGSGKGFQDHNYITTDHGSIHQWGVKVSDSGIYYYDGIHKKIFKLGGEGNAPISEMKGIHGTLNLFNGDVSLRKENGGDNPILGKGVHITKDKKNDEVLFTFLRTWKPRTLETNTSYSIGDIVLESGSHYLVTTAFTTGPGFPEGGPIVIQLLANSEVTEDLPNDKLTLVYDEIVGEFSSFYTSTPSIYIENGDLLLSSNPSTRKDIYRHNKGNYGEFYGIVEESSVKLILNLHADMNKILRFIEFNSIVRDSNKNIDRTQTITGFRVETEYQDTGKQLVDSGRIKRKFDKWRLKIPRDQNNGNTDRLRSTHFILTLYFDNTYNKELILNRITSYFDIQMF